MANICSVVQKGVKANAGENHKVLYEFVQLPKEDAGFSGFMCNDAELVSGEQIICGDLKFTQPRCHKLFDSFSSLESGGWGTFTEGGIQYSQTKWY